MCVHTRPRHKQILCLSPATMCHMSCRPHKQPHEYTSRPLLLLILLSVYRDAFLVRPSVPTLWNLSPSPLFGCCACVLHHTQAAGPALCRLPSAARNPMFTLVAAQRTYPVLPPVGAYMLCDITQISCDIPHVFLLHLLDSSLAPGPPCRSRTIHHRPPKAASLFLCLPISPHPPLSKLASSGLNKRLHRAHRPRGSPVAAFSCKLTRLRMASPATKALTAAATPTKATFQISHPRASMQTLRRTCMPRAPRVRGGFLPPCTSVVALTGACCPLQVFYQHTLNHKPLILNPAQTRLNSDSWLIKPPGVRREQRRLLLCLRLLLRLLLRLGTNPSSEPTKLHLPPKYIGQRFDPSSHCRQPRPQHRLRPPGQPPALALLSLVWSPHNTHVFCGMSLIPKPKTSTPSARFKDEDEGEQHQKLAGA